MKLANLPAVWSRRVEEVRAGTANRSAHAHGSEGNRVTQNPLQRMRSMPQRQDMGLAIGEVGEEHPFDRLSNPLP
jgi:hypothetical protein